MSSVDIYAILASKSHNEHYLKKYFKFILACCQSNSSKSKDELGYTEQHHFCPRSIWPEYDSLRFFPWNNAVLTARQHFIAHWMLWKTYGGSQSQAFWLMQNRTKGIKRSEIYAKVSNDMAERVSKKGKELAALGMHNAQIEAKEGRHHWQSKEHASLVSSNQRKKIEENNHVFLTEINRKLTSERMIQKAKDGIHPVQISLRNGTHVSQTENHSKRVSARNKDPEFIKRSRQIRLALSDRQIVHDIRRCLKENNQKAVSIGLKGNWTTKSEEELNVALRSLNNIQ